MQTIFHNISIIVTALVLKLMQQNELLFNLITSGRKRAYRRIDRINIDRVIGRPQCVGYFVLSYRLGERTQYKLLIVIIFKSF